MVAIILYLKRDPGCRRRICSLSNAVISKRDMEQCQRKERENRDWNTSDVRLGRIRSMGMALLRNASRVKISSQQDLSTTRSFHNLTQYELDKC